MVCTLKRGLEKSPDTRKAFHKGPWTKATRKKTRQKGLSCKTQERKVRKSQKISMEDAASA